MIAYSRNFNMKRRSHRNCVSYFIPQIDSSILGISCPARLWKSILYYRKQQFSSTSRFATVYTNIELKLYSMYVF